MRGLMRFSVPWVGTRRMPWGCLLLAGLALVLCDAPLARGDDSSVPPPANPPAGAPPEESVPDAAPRPRPEDPPPPGSAIPFWDKDHLDADVGLPPPLPRPSPFLLRDLKYRHDNLPASADGRQMDLRRVPQWVDVITRDDILDNRPLGFGTLGGRLPNVSMADLGNPFLAVPEIRGLGGQRVAILTDGIWPSSQALGRSGNTISMWDPETVERVEVYHGPGAYLKAIDSPGGFINIVSRRPRQHGALSADGRASSAYDSATGAWRNRFEVDIGAERTALLAGITFTSHENREIGEGGELDPSDFLQLSADAAFDYFLSPTSRIGLTVQHSRAYDIRSPLASSSSSQQNYERLFVAISLASVNPSEILQGRRISFSFDTFIGDDDRSIDGQDSALGNRDDVNRFDFEIGGRLQIAEGHETYGELRVGFAEFKRTETFFCPAGFGVDAAVDGVGAAAKGLHTVGGIPWTIVSEHSHSPRAEPGACADVSRVIEAEELRLTAILEDQVHEVTYDLYAGVRLDYYWLDQTGTIYDEETWYLSGAVGAAYHLNRRISVYGNASYGRRQPTIYELSGIEVQNGIQVIGNEDLDAETHLNLEVGLKSSFGDRWSFHVAGFLHGVWDHIRPVPLAGGTEQELQNAGDAWLYGAELASAWRPFPTFEGLELYTTLGFTSSTDSSVIDHSPFQYRGGVRYSVPQPQGFLVRRWFADLSIYGETESREGQVGGGGYTTMDLLFGTLFDLGEWNTMRFGFGARNLLDQRYRAADTLLEASGISFLVNLGIDF